jgi:hypothetical protein
MANTELKQMFNRKMALKPHLSEQVQTGLKTSHKTKKINRQISMTDEQIEKLKKLAVVNGYVHTRYGKVNANVSGYLQHLVDNLPEPPDMVLEK